MGKVRLSSAVEQFLAWARKNLAPGTVAGYFHYFKKFAAFAGDIRVESITPAMLTTWSNRWHAIQAIQRLLAWCFSEAKIIPVNPIGSVKPPPGRQRRRVLTPSESSNLLRRASRPLRRLLLALRESFARPGEMRLVSAESIRTAGNLPWTPASLLNGDCFFFLLKGKSIARRSDPHGVRLIPISPRLGRLLLRILSDADYPGGAIFRDSKGNPWTGNAVRCAMRRLCKRAGIGADWRGERVVAYTLRHSGATGAAAAGVRDFMLADILGHATTRTTRRYVHFSPDMIQEGMRRIIEAKSMHRAKPDLPNSLRRSPDDQK